LKFVRITVRWLLGAVFIFSGILHFTATESYTKIVPPALPAPPWLVYISGIFEILGGIALVGPVKRLRRFAAYGLIALLVAVFPANVYHALSNVKVEPLPSSPLYHTVRLPMQVVLIWLVNWSAKGERMKDEG
jgi:uncharacterized membrane protein